MKPFVVYWNNLPTPYMVERFNALADRSSVDFEAWFSDRIHPSRSWEVNEAEWRFRYRYINSSYLLGYTQHWPLPIFGRRPDVLISLYAEPAFLLGWLVAKLRGAKTAFWCQVTMDTWVRRTTFKNIVKRTVFPFVDATLGHGEESRKFAMQYGVPPAKAMTLPHCIDVDHYSTGAATARSDRDALRQQLGLNGITFLYVGRLWRGKGIGYLLDALNIVQSNSDDEVSLLLVGDGPDELELKQHTASCNMRNVVFAGFQQKHNIPKYYAASDVFVFPTLGDPYGLVVDEAMATALPIISTTAAGEITDRVRDGINGYTVPPQDSVALAERMYRLTADAELRVQMGNASARFMRDRTPEQWALNLERCVRKILSS